MSNINTNFINEVKKHNVEVHDIRGWMPTRGSYPSNGTTWRYCTVHYTGVWRERNSMVNDRASWVGHGRYHVNNRGWPGIAYNIGISPSGRVFLLKDIERRGYHAFNTNAISMAVSTDMTEGQVPTPQLLRSLEVVLQVLERLLPNLTRQNIYTHRQMGWHDKRNAPTLCAGFRLNNAIAARRAGTPLAVIAPATPPPPPPKPKPDHAYIELTDKWVIGPMFKEWTSIGGNVLVFGYPITGEFEEDGDNIQYFERAVFHRKPNSDRVFIQRIGVEVARATYGDKHPAFKPVKKTEDSDLHKYFSATQHTLSNGFKGYWEKYGGLKLFGYPISEEFEENGRVVQYFERARFEWHPGSDPKRYDVMLGRLGAEVLALRTPPVTGGPPYDGNTPILGTGTLTADEIDEAIAAEGMKLAERFAPDRVYKEPPKIGSHLLNLCKKHNVNWDLATAQIILESAGWQSKIVRTKNNPSGLGAIDSGPLEGAITFATPEDGVRATIAHLLSYTMGDDNPLRAHSVRHEVLRSVGFLGIAKNISDLTRRWATDPDYDKKITNIANRITKG